MATKIEEYIQDTFGIAKINEYEYASKFGLTFVFRRQIITLKNRISSCEIDPVGIIFEENGKYYFAPLHEEYEIEDIVHGFVDKMLIREVEYSHCPQ